MRLGWIERSPQEGLVVASEGDIVVALETALDADLIAEGLAREFVNKVQSMRKTADFEVTQRITVCFTGDDEVAAAVAGHASYIKDETLCVSLSAVDAADEATPWDLNGHAATIAVAPIAG